MIFKEIELSEALRIIGEGNPDKNLYVLDGDDYKYKALRDYRVVSIDSRYINSSGTMANAITRKKKRPM